MRRLLAASLAAAIFSACSGDSGEDTEQTAASCGLPTPRSDVDVSVVPQEFTLSDSAEITTARKNRGGFIAALNVPFSVVDAFRRFKDAAGSGGYDIVAQDNEGFEAEIYLERRGQFGIIQIRRSTCDDMSIAFVNVVARKSLMPPPSPGA